ncbi:hypothetical protein NP493_1359g00044 [Ridgeia piscesae]|uniref:Uncharacterized protein n=1 Tax=Ridgeia piscesae TaxID=27915 RepID=A0AAD9K6G4_RIDPI|nr:hypothetical protein NP493_1359g00044 [Ridgeia piscesae]
MDLRPIRVFMCRKKCKVNYIECVRVTLKDGNCPSYKRFRHTLCRDVLNFCAKRCGKPLPLPNKLPMR